MKAIETLYQGCRFRSRLEARWAVFFAALGLRWEYKAKAHDEAGPYLPDFWLPELGYWVEVKGERPTAVWVAKARALCLHTKRSLLCLVGQPTFPTWFDQGVCETPHTAFWYVAKEGAALETPALMLANPAAYDASATDPAGWVFQLANAAWIVNREGKVKVGGDGCARETLHHPRLLAAYAAARSASFAESSVPAIAYHGEVLR